MLAGNDAYMPSSFESIATATGTGSSGTITFSSIPSGYKALQLRITSKMTGTAGANTLYMTFNGSSTGYANHRLIGNGTSAVASGTANDTLLNFNGTSLIPDSSTSYTSINGAVIVDIIDYASTTKNKTVRSFAGKNNNAAGGEVGIVGLFSGLWANTSAITSITITTAAGNWTTTSSFALYGVK